MSPVPCANSFRHAIFPNRKGLSEKAFRVEFLGVFHSCSEKKAERKRTLEHKARITRKNSFSSKLHFRMPDFRRGCMDVGSPAEQGMTFTLRNSHNQGPFFYNLVFLTAIAVPGSPYRGQNGKIGKMTFLGSKKCLFWGSPLEPFKWGFWAFHSLPQYQILVKGRELNAPKTPFKWFQGEPPTKAFFLTPKMSFSRFSHFDLCRRTLGSQ